MAILRKQQNRVDSIGQQLAAALVAGKIADRDLLWAERISQAEYRQKYLSPRQAEIGREILARNKNGPAVEVTYGHFPHIERLFNYARAELKFPKLYLTHPEYKLKMRIMQTKTLNVQTVTWDGDKCGVLRDGKFAPYHWCDSKMTETVVELLTDFDKNHLEHAKISGIKFGACCFCGRELTNKLSVYHGYGPICAEKWGLPWEGETSEEEQNKILDALEQEIFGG